MKHWVKRMWFLWTFLKATKDARRLEVEYQQAQQRMHNEEFAGPYRRENYMYEKGFVDGIFWVIGRFKHEP